MTQRKDLSDEAGSDLSALVDGELPLFQVSDCLSRIDEPTSQRWAAYQLISESLRSGAAGALPEDAALTQSIMAACARESAVVISQPDLNQAPPAPEGLHLLKPPMEETSPSAVEHSANDPVFRWRWWAGAAAGLAAVSVALNVWQFQASPSVSVASASLTPSAPTAQPLQPTVVEAQVTVVAGQPPQTMLRDPRLDELLQAHRQAGATSALQSPAGFLRNATFQAQQP
jgi:sigma-E factor negative regulatory protein RseA